MKKKMPFLLLSLSSLLIIAPACSCFGGRSTSSEYPSSSISVDPTEDITVNFYIDYNAVASKTVYYSCVIKNGSKITDKPENPSQSPSEEFNTFLGWSKYQVINDESQLWNFATDKVYADSSNPGHYALYGIWVD